MLKRDPHETFPSSRKKPNYVQLLIRKKHTGEHPLADKVLLEPDSLEAKLWDDCIDIWEDKIKRSYVEAAIMTEESDEVLAEVFEMPVELVTLYRKACFNIEKLSRLDKVALLDKEETSEVLVMKMWAMASGMDFIRWRLGHKVEINPLTGLIELFTMCYNKSREAIFNPNVAKASQESTKWVKLSMDIARLLKLWTTDNDQARKDLEVAIKSVVPNFKSIDDLVAEAEKEPIDTKTDVEVSVEAEQIIEDIVKNGNDDSGNDSGNSG